MAKAKSKTVIVAEPKKAKSVPPVNIEKFTSVAQDLETVIEILQEIRDYRAQRAVKFIRKAIEVL